MYYLKLCWELFTILLPMKIIALRCINSARRILIPFVISKSHNFGDIIFKKHPRCISLESRDLVLDILSLLSKVEGGNTSNLNENLQGMIWNSMS